MDRHGFLVNLMEKPAANAPETDGDIALMQRVARGDDHALADLIDRWQGPLINFFHRSLGSRNEAEDFAQAVFIKLHRAAPRYEPTAKFSTYLFQIARRVLYNEYRRRGRKPLTLCDPADLHQNSVTNHDLPLLELEEVFQATLGDMPENHRTAILLLKQQELSYAEIAEAMGATESVVKTWIFRARQRLKEELRKTYE